MNLEQQVVSLELAKKLKELGVEQNSQFYWRLGYSTSESFDKGISTGKQGHFRDYEIIHNPKPRYTTADVKWNESDLRKLYDTEFSAFTVAELGEMLPSSILNMADEEIYWIDNFSLKQWGIKYIKANKNGVGEDTLALQSADTEADARAKMLIYLLENNLLK